VESGLAAVAAHAAAEAPRPRLELFGAFVANIAAGIELEFDVAAEAAAFMFVLVVATNFVLELAVPVEAMIVIIVTGLDHDGSGARHQRQARRRIRWRRSSHHSKGERGAGHQRCNAHGEFSFCSPVAFNFHTHWRCAWPAHSTIRHECSMNG
jgi:hypothetical protein